jgi:hypothetical protein
MADFNLDEIKARLASIGPSEYLDEGQPKLRVLPGRPKGEGVCVACGCRYGHPWWHQKDCPAEAARLSRARAWSSYVHTAPHDVQALVEEVERLQGQLNSRPAVAADVPAKDMEAALEASFREWLRANTPEGARVSIRAEVGLRVRVYCCGVDDERALACNLEPGHEGRCFSVHRLVQFDAVPRGG